MIPPRAPIAVLFPEETEAWNALVKRVAAQKGDIVLILTNREQELHKHVEQCRRLFEDLRPHRARVTIAVKHADVAAAARERGLKVISRGRDLSELLEGHGKLEKAMRVFSPNRWRQELTSRLQDLGLLSLPRLRILFLVGLSTLLFAFVVFRLLPSADISIKPRADSINQTANLYLVLSGATVTLPSHVQRMPLVPVTVKLTKSLVYDHIRRESIGSSSRLVMRVVNKTDDVVGLMKGTRFVNQAGMIFRIQKRVIVPANSNLTVQAVADDADLYGEVIGLRGNVAAGLRWDIPGLSPDEQKVIYGENTTAGEGGSTSYRTVLKPDDIATAKARLEQELEADAKVEVEKRRDELNVQDASRTISLLMLPELIHKEYSDFSEPTDQLGKEIPSFTIQGTITFTVLGYDSKAILDLLAEKLRTHVREGKELLQDSLTSDHLDVRVIYFDDNLTWVKLTVDLTGSEQYILDPLTPTGALFAKRVRDSVLGLPKSDALRIIRNLPEVDNVEISLWPPLNQTMPTVPSHISISPE